MNAGDKCMNGSPHSFIGWRISPKEGFYGCEDEATFGLPSIIRQFLLRSHLLYAYDLKPASSPIQKSPK